MPFPPAHSFRIATCLLTIALTLTGCGGGGGGDHRNENSVGSGNNSGSNNEPGTSPVLPPEAAATPMQILVPAYFNPANGWAEMTQAAKDYPGVKITAILNPSNGIFSAANSQFTTAVKAFKAEGGSIVGYVMTKYGNRSVSDVKTNIDNYLTHYPDVDGFFLDEMEAKGKQLAFYQEISKYIRDKKLQLQIIGNPGTPPAPGYADIADVLVNFEGKEVDYRKFNPQPQHSWIYDKPSTAQAMLVHNAATCSLMQQALGTAALPRTHTGLVYVTNLEFDYSTGVGNPWKSLPSYWPQFIGSVNAINHQQPLPPC